MALPTSAAPGRIRPPFRSAKGPSAEAPSALPKPAGCCSVSSRHCPSSWHGSEGSRCHPGSGTGTGWPQSVKHKGRKGGTGSSECCSSSGSKKPPWDGSAFVLRRWHSAIPARSGRDSVLPILLQTRAHKQLEQEQQEAPGTTRPFASDANGAALPPASMCQHVSQDGSFQRSHGLHALKPSTSSCSDTPMLLLRTSVFLPVTHPGGDLSPLPSPSSIPPSNSC